MTEFTIDIATVEGATNSEDALDRITQQLEASAAVDPSLSINTETGVLAATFQLRAESIPDAASLAMDLLGRALIAANIVTNDRSVGGEMLVSSDDVASVTVAPTRDREPAGV
jgi:hypothetical protein